MIGIVKHCNVNVEVKSSEKEITAPAPLAPEIIRTGLMNDEEIHLEADAVKLYTLPENSKIFAIEFVQAGSIEVGTTEESATDGALYSVEEPGGIVQLGLSTITEMYIYSEEELTIIPIIYKYK